MTAELPAGALVDARYEIQAVCGRGGMSTVYRARDTSLGREVALKVFHAASTGDDARRRDEAVLLAGLSHPGLVVLFDAVLDRDPPYVTMEFVDGESLADRLRRGSLDLDSASATLVATADALGAVHARGIVHRDVKPANILLPSDDAHSVARLADFGIARLIEAPSVTVAGTVIGTAAYLSPEQVTGGPVTTASDIYALGLVLIECLTGRRAFAGTAVETMAARLARPPDLEDPALAPYRSLLADMTQRDPEQRPSAAEVAARLRGEAETRILPSPDAATEPAGILRGVPETTAASTAATRLLTSTETPEPSASAAADRPRSRRTILLAALGAATLAVLVGAIWAATGVSGDSPEPAPTDATVVDTTQVPVSTSEPQPAETVAPEPSEPAGPGDAGTPGNGPAGDPGTGNGHGNGPKEDKKAG